EEISGEVLYTHFMKGIKHSKFKIRMEAALQGESKSLDNFTKVTFRQLAIILETKEDAKGYDDEPETTRRQGNKKGTSSQSFDDKRYQRRKFHERQRRENYKKPRTCHICDSPDHLSYDCPKNPKKHKGEDSKRRYSLKAITAGSGTADSVTSKAEAPYLNVLFWLKTRKDTSQGIALLDTGSQVNVITEQALRRLEGFTE
ncbi:hypothetical protein ADUPG1_004388, partial [Aduncisulcus paluster]